MTRFYIGLSLGFKNTDNLTYPVKKIASAIKRIGGENVRTAKYLGESVVTFSAKTQDAANLYAVHASMDVYPNKRSSVLAAYKWNG
jgi:hypothetical protein